MSFEILQPVSEALVAHTQLVSDQSLGKYIEIHSKQFGLPEIENVNLAIVGVLEDRNTINNIGCGSDLSDIRKNIYDLLSG